MDDSAVMIPYFAHEGEMARAERTNKRLWVLIILLIVALVGSNLAWIIYENQFVEESVTQEVDTGNGAAVVSGIGDAAYYGEDQANGQKACP